MGFFGNVGPKIRNLLRWDKERIALNLAKGGTASSFPTSGFDLLQAYGYDVLSDYLKLEHDLMTRYVDYEEMDDYPELASAIDIYADDACITSDTEIPLLDGTVETVGSLYDRVARNEWIYAFDTAKKRVVAGQFDRVDVIAESLPVYKVTFRDRDGNIGYIKATDNHKFLMLNGKYQPTSALNPGDRLMALFKFVYRNKNRKQDYEQVLVEPFARRWQSTHRMVLESLGTRIPEGHVVHHKDHDGLNNTPHNLGALPLEDHVNEHRRFGASNPRFRSDITADDVLGVLADGFVSKKAIEERLGCGFRVVERLVKELGYKNWTELKAEHFGLDRRSRGHESSPDTLEKYDRIVSSLVEAIRTDGDISFFGACERLSVPRWIAERAITKTGHESWSHLKVASGGTLAPGRFSSVVCQDSLPNDVVISVEPAGEERIFDLVNSVPTHNFAAGHDGRYVFIKNTQTESLKNRTVWVDSDDKTVGEIVTDCFDNRLRIDEEMWSMARTLAKYGQDYEEMLVTQDGLVGLNFLPPPTMRRIEGRRGELFGFVQDFKSRFGYCLAKGSRVWGANACAAIQDFDERKAVVAYKDGAQVPLGLVKRHANGVKKVFKVKTLHRTVFLTEDHPVLAVQMGGQPKWTKVKDLKIVRFNGAKHGIDQKRSSKIIISTRMPQGEVPEWSAIWSEDPFDDAKGSAKRKEVALPGRVTPEFCRLFGFLLGDGWLEEGDSQRVSYARGEYPELNDRYDALMRSLGLDVSIREDGAQSRVTSVRLVRLLKSLGWISGAEYKRVPSWVYGLPEKHRDEFLWGFIDADGWDEKQEGKRERHSFEIANYELARDLKNLIDGLGYKCGNIGCREREPGTVIRKVVDGQVISEKTIQSQLPCYYASFTDDKFDEQFVAENVLSISYYEDAEVYDLEVKDPAHNFIADGVVVHNSPDEFKNLLAQRMAYGDSANPADRVVAMEDWEVLHMRLRSKHRRSIYGYSVLEPARWIWKRLMLLEDAAMVYRLQRAPERYAFYVDVGDMPPKEAFAYLNKTRQQYKKTKFYNPQCLTAETCITCLDGVDRSMAELARDFGDKEFWVYSYDLESGRVVPGKASKPRKTGEKQPVWRIVLDNGATVRCTGNHPFLMRDGSYKAANTLGYGDSLMPMYLSRGSEGTLGYWTYREPSTKKREYVHQMVARAVLGEDYAKSGLHAHHIDHNKKNNTPDNLVGKTPSEHMLEHPENAMQGWYGYRKRVLDDAEFRTEIAGRLQKWRDEYPEEAKASASAHGRKVMELRKAEAKDGQAGILEIIECEVVRDPLVVAEELVERLNGNPEFVGLYGALPTTTKSEISTGCLHAFLKRQGFDGFKDFKNKKTGQARWRNRTYGGEPTAERQQVMNHKVVAVYFEGYEDVYNLDVEKYHNFALTAGVFTHNTGKLDLRFNPLGQDEDFFIPIRKGVQTSRVEVLGAPSWQHMEDIEYFRLKLFSAIKVPKVYLGFAEGTAKGVLCFSGDTKVPLLDGRTLTMKEVAEEFGPDGKFHVYSCDEKGMIVPGEAHGCQVTRPNAEVWELELDDGSKIRATPDHPFMMRDGSYKELQELRAGDSLMPLYRCEASGDHRMDKLAGYEMIEHPATESFEYTHRMVARNIWGERWWEGENGDEYVCHHSSFDKKNNDPRHLSKIEKVEHVKFHAEMVEKTLKRPDVMAKRKEAQRAWACSEENRELLSRNCKLAKQKLDVWRRSDRHRSMKSDQMRGQWADRGSAIAMARSGKASNLYRSDASLERLTAVCRDYRCTSFNQAAKWSGYSYNLIRRLLKDAGITTEGFAKQHFCFEEIRTSAASHNHKVKSIRFVGHEDCYDFTVETYHNFAVGATTDDGQVSEIIAHNSQEDVRFARTVLRLQRELRNGLKKMGRVHLAALNVNPAAVNFEVYMTVPSSIFELAQLEVRNAKADFAARMSQFVSLHWILQKVFGLSDHEIEFIIKQRHEEQLGDAEIQAKAMGFQMKEQGTAQQKQMQQQQAMQAGQQQAGAEQQAVQAEPGSPQAAEARMRLREYGGLSQLWPLRRQQYGYKPITERELFQGNRDHEKRMEDNMGKVLKSSNALSSRVTELGELLHEIRHSMPTDRHR